jgi:hypothetical protein
MPRPDKRSYLKLNIGLMIKTDTRILMKKILDKKAVIQESFVEILS